MKTYIFDSFNRFTRFSQKLDTITEICNRSWIVVNDSIEKEVFIFQNDYSLFWSVNGKVIKGQWQYLAANNSLVLTIGDNSYMLHPFFYNNDIWALQLDGTEEYVFWGDESKLKNMPQDISELTNYLEKKYEKANNGSTNMASKNNSMIPIVIAVSCFMLLILSSVLILGSGKTKNEDAVDSQTEWNEFISKRDAEVAEQRRIHQETKIESFIDYNTTYNISGSELYVIDGNFIPEKIYKYSYAEVSFSNHRIIISVGGNTYTSRIKNMKFTQKEDWGNYKKAELETEDGYVKFCVTEKGGYFLSGKFKKLTFIFHDFEEIVKHNLINSYMKHIHFSY